MKTCQPAARVARLGDGGFSAQPNRRCGVVISGSAHDKRHGWRPFQSGQQNLCQRLHRRVGLQAMSRKLNHWGYYVMATRQSAYPPSWRWRIVMRGKPMGVRIEGGGCTTYEAARLAGSRA